MIEKQISIQLSQVKIKILINLNIEILFIK